MNRRIQGLLGLLFRLFCLVSISSSFLVAQTINVQKIGVDEGLSSNTIHDVHTDKYGYKWITTNHGLNKYDGISIEIYRYDPQDTLSIRANSLSKLFEDIDGNIWATIDIGGISFFDRAANEFHYFSYDPANLSNPNNYVVSALFDKKGRNWIGTWSGINFIDKAKQRFQPIPVPGFDRIYVNAIHEDSNGNIWVAANEGLFEYDEVTKQLKEVKDATGNAITQSAVFQDDNEGNLWVGSGEKLWRVDNGKKVPKIVRLPEGKDASLTAIFATKNADIAISVFKNGLFEWKNNRWFRLKLNGIRPYQVVYGFSTGDRNKILIQGTENKSFLVDATTYDAQLIPNFNYQISSFWIDEKDGGVWLGTNNFGLFKVFKTEGFFQNLEVSNGINSNYSNFVICLFETQDGQTYFSTNSGLFELEAQKKKINTIIDHTIPGAFQLNVVGIYEFDNQNLLLSTTKGIYKLNRLNHNITPFLPINARIDEMAIHENKLWAIGGFGLLKYDLTTKEIYRFCEYAETPIALRTGMSRALLVDKHGAVWVGAERDGLIEVIDQGDKYDFVFHKYAGLRNSKFLSHTVNVLFEDADQKLWVGGFSSGFLEFDRATKTFINHTPKGELPIPKIQAIQQADDGCFWISSVNGIHKFIPDTKTFKKYTTSDGLVSNSFIWRSSTKTKEGYVAFGTYKGITLFDPSKEHQEEDVPSVLIENITAFSKSLEFHNSILNTTSVSFPYNQNSLAVNFIALDFTSQEKINYAYRLKGSNDEWINLGENRTVNLTKMRPGKYNFEVRATFNKGTWSEPTSLLIQIQAPFWLKSWFFVLIAVVFLFILWMIYRYHLNQKLQRILFLEEVRQKAAADFHDEMGNKLTRIALFTDVLKQKLNGTSKDISDYVAKIGDNSRSLNSSMRDFLWALDPKKDSAHDAAVLLKDFGQELFDKTNIEFEVERIETSLQRYKLDMDWKRNLIMIFKEAMHNILKHAEASKVSLRFELRDENLQIQLTDNGKGIQELGKLDGYGLKNMNYRCQQLGGELKIEPLKAGGTSVQFTGSLKSFSIK